MIICADDYGMAPDINEAIIELATDGRITAVSVMAALPAVDRVSVAPLSDLGGKIDMGLHLVFNDADSLSGSQPFPEFRNLVSRCWLGLLSVQFAEREIAAQHEAFCQMAGRPPDFIDGHMHVQQFPVIRQALTMFVQSLPGEKPYVRNSYMPLGDIMRQGVSPLKTWLLSLPGKRMKKILTRAAIPTNDGFTGIYDFALHQRYPEFLSQFIKAPPSPSTLLMAHPGKVEPWRRAEYEALSKTDGIGAIATRFLRQPPEGERQP
ncbi:MAG: ChbG/HpnK family deacetylase [Nitrospinota bacterium]|nr:ChbG/HpnK family deacetylase [Nitrospinota bacterium]